MIPWSFILRIAAPILVAVLLWTWGYSAGSAQKQRAWDLATSAQVRDQLAATEAARARETALQLQVERANEARKLDNAKNARIAAALRRDADGLRRDIANFANGPPEDSRDACGQRAATLGVLLDEALRTGGECASAAESLATDLRAVIQAWPK